MKEIEAIGYAQWAMYIVNGDPSELSDADFAACQAWLAYHGLYDYECTGAREDEHTGYPDMPRALQGVVMTFTFLVDKKDFEARCAA